LNPSNQNYHYVLKIHNKACPQKQAHIDQIRSWNETSLPISD
jgi:hypothetical protein